MKTLLGQMKALENRLETEFRRLTDAELQGDFNEVKRHQANVDYYKAELEALKISLRKPFKMGAL